MSFSLIKPMLINHRISLMLRIDKPTLRNDPKIHRNSFLLEKTSIFSVSISTIQIIYFQNKIYIFSVANWLLGLRLFWLATGYSSSSHVMVFARAPILKLTENLSFFRSRAISTFTELVFIYKNTLTKDCTSNHGWIHEKLQNHCEVSDWLLFFGWEIYFLV